MVYLLLLMYKAVSFLFCTIRVLIDFFFCRYDLYLSFEESIFGAKRDIEVSCFETCDNCGGTGAKSSSCIKNCMDCGGRGGVMKTQRTPFGMMSQVVWLVNRCLAITLNLILIFFSLMHLLWSLLWKCGWRQNLPTHLTLLIYMYQCIKTNLCGFWDG